ncbi:MAG: aspartate-semialdehyde dehydrogenase [Bacteroidales bacterium]|nr:aspartate-semialdehyde dehydrogenase [Bacteroidales bacterium]
MKIAVVGATGLVGGVMLQVLEERGFANEEIIVAASAKSVGKKIAFAERELEVVSVESAIESNCDYAIFSAGGSTSKQYAPLFAEKGTIVIDNSSAWRMNEDVPLVVPEINFSAIKAENRIIANPNCSTIQMVLALSNLHKAYGIKRIVVSTYQSVTGTGVKAVRQLECEQQGLDCEKAYPHKIHENILPHGGDFLENGYTTEEQKLVGETRKIFDNQNIQISATVARVPVKGGHSESVNVEFEKQFELSDVYKLLQSTSGVCVLDKPLENVYPMPFISQGKDEVFVGRVRRDTSCINGLNLWIVADNLRKGAATNAIQILEYLVREKKKEM